MMNSTEIIEITREDGEVAGLAVQYIMGYSYTAGEELKITHTGGIQTVFKKAEADKVYQAIQEARKRDRFAYEWADRQEQRDAERFHARRQ